MTSVTAMNTEREHRNHGERTSTLLTLPTRLHCTIDMNVDHVTQLRKGALELAVLAMLDSRPSYGFELVEGLDALPGLDATKGTIYPLLTRLKNAGLVDTTWQESPKGPPRKYYVLSPAGSAELATQTATWRQVVAAMDSLLPKEAR